MDRRLHIFLSKDDSVRSGRLRGLTPCQISVLRAAQKGGANRQAISSAPGRIEANVVFGSESVVSLSGDRGFESIFLQRRVCCEPDFREHIPRRTPRAIGCVAPPITAVRARMPRSPGAPQLTERGIGEPALGDLHAAPSALRHLSSASVPSGGLGRGHGECALRRLAR
jgi:hypothetical protein